MPNIKQMPENNLTMSELDRQNTQPGSVPSQVKVYRYADLSKAQDWISLRRQKGIADAPPFSNINTIALQHRQGMRHGQPAGDSSPFISVATSWKAIFESEDVGVQNFLKLPTISLVEFDTPRHYLFRPKPCAPISIRESEWLYYDYPENIGNWLQAVYVKPKDTNAVLVVDTNADTSKIATNVPAHRNRRQS
jgi:hypothetical protein